MLRNNQPGQNYGLHQQGFSNPQQSLSISPQHQQPQISISPHGSHGPPPPPPPPLLPGPQPPHGPLSISGPNPLQPTGIPPHLTVGMRHPSTSQQVRNNVFFIFYLPFIYDCRRFFKKNFFFDFVPYLTLTTFVIVMI